MCFAGLAEVSPRVKLVKEDVSQVSQGVSRWIHAVNLCNESVAPRSLRIAHHLCCNARCNRAVTRAVSAVYDVTYDVSLAAPRSGGP